jgi:hypothetical protein
MNGTVQGGWAFVYAAYIISVLVFGGYAVHAIVLHRLAKQLGRHGRG